MPERLTSMATSKQFVVYILASQKGGTLYVGVTSDLPHRAAQHRDGALPSFTKKYGVKRLVHIEYFDTAELAIAREKKLKHWLRAWKIALIEASNPDWRDLSPELAGMTELAGTPAWVLGSAAQPEDDGE